MSQQPTPAELAAAREFSLKLQGVAGALQDVLKEATGGKEPPGFVLVIDALGSRQYIANVPRDGGTQMLEDILARWRANRPDVPGHVNPALGAGPRPAVTVYGDRAEHFINVLSHAIAKMQRIPGEQFTTSQLRELRKTLGG